MIETAWRRVQSPTMLRDACPGTRVWQREVHDGHLSVLVGRELIKLNNGDQRLLWHLSISHRTCTQPPKPGRYPTWDEIRQAREQFVPDDVTVAMLLPPKAEYVNEHATTFHLWEIGNDS